MMMPVIAVSLLLFWNLQSIRSLSTFPDTEH